MTRLPLAVCLLLGLVLPAEAQAPRPDRQGDALPQGAVARVTSPALREPGGVTLLSFSPDGTRLAAVGGGKFLVVADAATGAERLRLGGSRDRVTALAFSADGSALTAVGPDQYVRQYDATSGKMLRTVQLSPTAGSSFSLSADGRLLAHLDADGEPPVRLLDAASGNELARFGRPRRAVQGADGFRLQLAPDGKTLASWDGGAGQLVLWESASGREIGPVRGEHVSVGPLAFSADGRMLVSGDGGVVSVWETATGRLRRRLVTADALVKALALSPDGRYLVAGGEGEGATPGGSPALWELRTGKRILRLTGHAGRVSAVAYSPNGKRVATGGPDGTLLVWDVAAQNARRSPPTKLSAPRLEGLWADLGSEDAGRAYDAVCALAEADGGAASFLGERLRGAAEAGGRETLRLIADLGSSRFALREKAMAALRRLGEAAGPALRHALGKNPSDEVRRRLEQLLAPLGKGQAVKLSEEQVRATRALEALEHAGTPEVRAVLVRLSRGEEAPWLAGQAAASLRRLGGP
jgi:WD40 repeat protein